ncbi:MAG: M20/M25/M40 family metallo-hydrolase [Endomicrobia bacterium]|nr:M20/M25/M40 family metallo-hydrolase [Endomicrobiia bacterium]
MNIELYIEKNKSNIIKFLSQVIKIKSYSSQEEKLVTSILHFLRTKLNTKKLYVKRIKNNIIILLPKSNCSQKVNILFDAHIDTVPVENINKWKYPPFSGKVVDDKIYGRGATDTKASLAALVFTIKFLTEINYNNQPIAFSLSSNEEDSSGKGITEIMNYVKPRYCVICEPSDLKIVYGHKGKWCVKLTFYGKPAHSSSPQNGINAIYLAYPLIKKIIHTKPQQFKNTILGKPTYTITYIESKTNSLNSLPYECSVYIDYRSVIGETEESIKSWILKSLEGTNIKFDPVHRFFAAWVLNKTHKLFTIAKNVYKHCFGKKPEPILWQFCTNGSVTMVDFKIPTIGFGPGSPYLAHQDNEYVKIEDVFSAIKFYSLFCLHQEGL